MSASDQLRRLRDYFPRARELAVSPALLEAWECELASALRYVDTRDWVSAWAPDEVLRGCVVRRLPLRYRGVPLVEAR